MKLHDAIRNDGELLEDLEDLFDAERERQLIQFENADHADHPRFAHIKAYLDALKQIRFLLVKGVRDHG